jgi:hypothetical protein
MNLRAAKKVACLFERSQMNKDKAKTIAEDYLSGFEKSNDFKLALNPDLVEEHELGFIFFYNTKEYWETRDYQYALAGNGPLLIRRDTGEVVSLPSNQSVEKSLAALSGHSFIPVSPVSPSRHRR